MSELIKTVWDKLYAWAIPSAAALGAFWLFVYPRATVFGDGLGKLADDEKVALFVVLTATLAICLSALATPMYRILEGYLFWPDCLRRQGIKRQLRRREKLRQDVAGTGWQRGLAVERLTRYPLLDEQIVPTRFGNAIRAFETYGKTRFNLDSQTLWYELCASAPEYIQKEMDSANASVNFFVALLYLSFSFGIFCLVLAGFEVQPWPIVLIGIAAFLLSKFWHWLAIRAIDNWSHTVQALVNLGRVKLAKDLGLEIPASLAAEKTMWGLVVSHVFYGKPEYGEALDPFRIPIEPDPS